MSRQRKGEKAYIASHVRLYIYMLDSPAWQIIPAAAKCLYVEVLREWRGLDKNNIKLSYSLIREHLGFSSPTISRALIFLDKFGFLKWNHQENHGGLFKNASIYSLSDEWKEIKSSRDVEEATTSANLEITSRKKKSIRESGKQSDAPLGNYKYSQKLTQAGRPKPVSIELETNPDRLETNPGSE